jgi:competence protein ComEA
MRALAISLLFVSATAAALDVNLANQAQLEAVRGVGPALAEKILEQRQRRAFADWADFVARVPGVGTRRATQLAAAGLTIGTPADHEGGQAPGASRP